MKIGILTFYCSDNYGAMLQAYGLMNFVKKINSTNLAELDYEETDIFKSVEYGNNKIRIKQKEKRGNE